MVLGLTAHPCFLKVTCFHRTPDIMHDDVKGWLNRCIEAGYKPTRDQEALTRLMIEHLDVIRPRPLRSFRRLESALRQLVDALRSGKHVVTSRSPSNPSSAP